MKIINFALAILGMTLLTGTVLTADPSSTAGQLTFQVKVLDSPGNSGSGAVHAMASSQPISLPIADVTSLVIKQYPVPTVKSNAQRFTPRSSRQGTLTLSKFGGDTLADGSNLVSTLRTAIRNQDSVSVEVDFQFPPSQDPSAPVGSTVMLSGVTDVQAQTCLPTDMGWDSLDAFETTKVVITYTDCEVSAILPAIPADPAS